MDDIVYRRLPAAGPGSIEVRAPLHEFLLEVPHLFYLDYVPPIRVVNAYLALGRSDAGMSGGCEWDPLVLSEERYSAVVRHLRENEVKGRNGPLRFADVPPTIARRNEWISWVLHTEIGIPYEEHLELVDKEEELREKARRAAERGDANAAELHVECCRVGTMLVELCRPYMERYRRG